ncbi:MAG: hypothetical protein ACRD4F_18865, partial [Candidatus Angelobacter sp.]
HMIKTDGVSCCVIRHRHDYGQEQRRGGGHCEQKAEVYVDELPEALARELSIRKLDSGMNNLLTCSTVDGSGIVQHTNNQRRFETKRKKYRQIRDNEKSEAGLIDGRRVAEWESTLSEHNHKTVCPMQFAEYIRAKLLVNSKIGKLYGQQIFRKLKLDTYFNVQRSERRLMALFKAIFGPVEDTLVAFGDWEQRRHRKFKEPVKGKGWRAVLRKHGYKVLLMDEFRTSVQCSRCQTEDAKCSHPISRLDPNRKKPAKWTLTMPIVQRILEPGCECGA